VLVYGCSYYFAGPRTGQSELFADNLPTLPDNIRLSADGLSLWVSSVAARFAGQWSSFDQLVSRPWARLLAAKILPLSLLHSAVLSTHAYLHLGHDCLKQKIEKMAKLAFLQCQKTANFYY
jgi:hypothetical protein